MQPVCPNCGTLLSEQPLPREEAPVSPAPSKTLTGRAWSDFLLGAAMQYLAHLATTRALIRTVPAPNPAAAYDFVGISRDWGRDSAVINVTLLDVAELLVLGALGYFLVRRFYPIVARGFGYATLALFVILLGAFFTCHLVTY